MSTINERIRERRLQLDMTQEELGLLLGFKSRSSINKIEQGRPIKQSQVLAFAKALKTSTKWLIDGVHDDYTNDGLYPMPQLKTIPLVGTIACGTPILASENIAEMLQIPSKIRADFALLCKGDSMVNAGIQDGDIVYIRKQPDVENGQIAAVRIGEEATLKRVVKSEKSILLLPENSKYAPIVITDDNKEDIVIEGLAVGFTRYWG